MSIQYDVTKCKYFAFVQDKSCIDNLIKPLTNVMTIDEFSKMDNDFEDKLKYFKHFSLLIDAESEIFSDIEIDADGENVGVSSSQRTDSNDLNSTIIMDGSKQVVAFTNNKFAINRSKRTAGIESSHPKQNHEVIDSIAHNGVLYAPEVSTKCSIGRLFNALSKYNSFDLIIMHKSLEEPIREGAAPSEYVMPVYTLGEGEITAVFYRYICTYFYGYIGIFNEEDREHNYDL